LDTITNEAFSQLGPNNPLKSLARSDQKRLWSFLKIFSISTNPNPKDDELERIAKLVSEAGDIAVRLEAEIFNGTYSDVLYSYTSGFRDLPTLLEEFSMLMEKALQLIGKRGHMGQNLVNQLLVVASEFVKLKIGEYFDEQVAELYQVVSESSLEEDLSGAAIHKKRAYLKRNYPELYADAIEKARSASMSTH
jgi:hypothetical protein